MFRHFCATHCAIFTFNRVFLNAAVNIEKHQEFQTKLEGLFIEIIREFYQKNVEISFTKSKQVLVRFWVSQSLPRRPLVVRESLFKSTFVLWGALNI